MKGVHDKNSVAKLVLLGLALCFIALILFQVFQTSTSVDLKTGCPLNEKGSFLPTKQMIVVIDQSEDVPENQQLAFIKKISERLQGINEVTHIQIFTFNDSEYRDLKPKFSRCVDQSNADHVLTAINNQQALFDSQKVIPSMLKNIGGASSPIIEAIFDITKKYNPYVNNEWAKKRDLIIFSDLIQNFDGLSMYGSHDSHTVWLNKAGHKIQPNWKHLKENSYQVSVYRVNRKKDNFTNQNYTFWQDLFYAAGAAGKPSIENF